jgi:LysR family hydrogen peroxide-inducible transcriptional activator
MNLQQLEYIIALETHGSFSKAAEAKFVSQPALSMMIQKLEEELDLKIFDRSRQPIAPTEAGKKILQQARVILYEVSRLREINREEQETLSGELRIGIIPTLAPYLLPLFLKNFMVHYPQVSLRIYEHTTATIEEKLRKGNLDAGLMVSPLPGNQYREMTLFQEPFHVYSHDELSKRFLLPEDINPTELWLLEEGHCLRSQILKLCELRRKAYSKLEFEAGSIDTLIKMVDHQQGITIVPELATLTMTAEQRKRLRPFAPPVPMREVSLITLWDFPRKKLLEALQSEILASIPPMSVSADKGKRINIGD